MKLKLFFIIYYLNIFSMVLRLVCSIFLVYYFKLKLVGALTSKPFAFKAWSWELNSSYIIDLTNCFNDKIRIDSKSLEIVRILPWLNSNLQEEWISDKIRFSYDGLSLNRVSRFFLKWKNLFYPIIFFFSQLLDPLFQKYFEIYFNDFNFKKLVNFKSNKENIYVFFFSLFKILYFFKNLNVNFDSKRNFFFETSNFFYLTNNTYIGNLKNKYSKFLLNLLNSFLFTWKKLLKSKNLFLKKFKKLDYLSNKNVNIVVISYFSNFYLNKKINFFLEPNFNLLLVGLFKVLNFKFFKKNNLKLKTFTLNIFTTNLSLSFFKNKFSKIFNLKQLKSLSTIILFNSNLRVVLPTFHLFLRKLVKNNDLLVISLSANDTLLFKHLNLGNKLNVLNKIICGQHWTNSFLVKKKKSAFFFNFDNLNLRNLTKILNLKNLANNLNYSFFTIKHKIYFLSKIYIFPLSSYNIVNYCDNIDFLLFKNKSIYNTSLYNDNLLNSNIYICNTILNKNLNFYLNKKNFFEIKYNLFILLESNIVKFNSKLWDFVFPISNITENFFLVKNYFKKTNKSLFLKLGPWLSRSFFNYVIYFFNLSIFPLFFLKKNNIFQNINFFFLNFWFEGSIIFLKINSQKYLKFILQNYLNFNFIKNNKYKLNININSKNHWYTEISFIKSSKYRNIGYNLLKKEKTTF